MRVPFHSRTAHSTPYCADATRRGNLPIIGTALNATPGACSRRKLAVSWPNVVSGLAPNNSRMSSLRLACSTICSASLQLVAGCKHDDQITMDRRQRARRQDHAPFADCAKATSSRSICATSLRLTGIHVQADRPRHGLDDGELVDAGGYGKIAKDSCSRRAWRNPLNNAGHLPHKLYSNIMKPVALPPGRDGLLT
jgi:hypothetical protein